MIAIGGGGMIPARILRTFIDIPVLNVGVQLYDKEGKQFKDGPKKFQWLSDSEIRYLDGNVS